MNRVNGYVGFLLLFMALSVLAEEVLDKSRGRLIPFEISYPEDKGKCTITTKCSIAFLSAGYGVPHTKYSFLVDELVKLNYLVVAIGHELPNDPPLSVTGNLYETRSENWARGATTLDFIRGQLSPSYRDYDFNNILLIGHSNGGDISAWLGNEEKPYIDTIITLDHRRVPLPRSKNFKIYSIRASDFPADKGVLPSENEQTLFNMCVTNIPEARHNDMTDYGPSWLKDKIRSLVRTYLSKNTCHVEKGHSTK